jgi:hypothetical protein
MKKIFLTALLCIVARLLPAQTITAAEFFVDADPGVGNATSIAVTPGAAVNFTANVATASLSNGFHVVGIRARDNAGVWGLYETRGFFITSSTSNVTNITAAEFFIDTDPGVGNGTSIPVTTGASVTFAAVIPTTSLAAGFHFICVRTRDAEGKWGLYETRGLFITSSTSNVTNITAAEFFVDTDPGVGNGTAVAVTPGATVTFTTNINTTSLSAGFHFAAFRTRDAEGKWGLYETRGFYISTATANVGNIVAAEFFIDTDPGAGSGTAITIVPGTMVTFVATVPTTSLAPGFHFAAIRTKDAEGKWGLYEARGFYITTQSNNVGNIVTAEYFIDADPGVGNGSAITVPNAATINQDFILNIPVGTTNGQHLLAVRFRDADGKWGLFDFDTIDVSGVVLPLQFLQFEAYKNQQQVLLKWKTSEEVNTSHFEVERSFNGVDFINIGRVAAQNRPGTHEYTFTDRQPRKGLNLYRLKQVDVDGRSEYSRIARVLFDAELNMAVYPNPATDKLSIVLSDGGTKWMTALYDVQGKLVKQELLTVTGNTLQVDVAKLAPGVYSLTLNNGLTTLHARFVKQ